MDRCSARGRAPRQHVIADAQPVRLRGMTTSPAPLDDPSVTDAAQVAPLVATDLARGLTAQEAARRLAQEGPNELRSVPPLPAWRRILAQFHDPLVYLLLGAVVVSLAAWLI